MIDSLPLRITPRTKAPTGSIGARRRRIFSTLASSFAIAAATPWWKSTSAFSEADMAPSRPCGAPMIAPEGDGDVRIQPPRAGVLTGGGVRINHQIVVFESHLGAAESQI